MTRPPGSVARSSRSRAVVGDALARAEVRDRGRVSEALVQPLRREERRADRRRSRPVGIRLGRHAGAFGLATADQREHSIDVPPRRRVDVAVVHVGAGRARRPDDLLGAVDQRLRSQLDDVTRVRERRHPGGRRQLRDGEVLGRIDAGCVADEHADTDGAGGEVGRDLVEDPRQLCRGRSPLPLGADQPAEDRRSTPVERPVRDHVHARRRP